MAISESIMLVRIPETLISRLQGLGAHFIRVRAKSKKPMDKGWTENPLFGDDPLLVDHLRKGGNYGVACGYGLVVIDADVDVIKELVENELPETFTVGTPSGGKHYYFLCGLEKGYVLRNPENKDENWGHIQARGKMVVEANCVHPSGGIYHDVPLAQVTKQDLEGVFKDCLVPHKEIHESMLRAWKERQEFDVDILNVVPLSGLRRHGDEFYGSHPVHGSTTGQNFWINPIKGCWHCFRCQSGGGWASLLAVMEGIINCEEARSGALRGDKFKEVCMV